MHHSLLLITNTPSKREIKRLMAPFEETYGKRKSKLATEYDDEDGYWYNPNAHWDWYEVGGRYRGRIPARRGVKSPVDDDLLQYDWYRKYIAPDCYTYAKVEDINLNEFDPNKWFCVLTPDGVWHERETLLWRDGDYVVTSNDSMFADFVESFVTPYAGCTAVAIDVHI